MPEPSLWAVTSYFNPAGSELRRRNYGVFRENLQVPLIAAELSFNGRFELGPRDADILVRATSGDVMWQKERLLNLAMEHLPEECKYVAWLDCDIVFNRRDWAAAVIDELHRSAFCQPYRKVCHVGPGVTRNVFDSNDVLREYESFGYACAKGLPVSPGIVSLKGGYKRGHASCARRSVLDGIGLYDRNIAGSGDVAVAFAAARRYEEFAGEFNLTDAHIADYLDWAKRFGAAVRGRIGYVEGEICHLWHGDLKDRRYSERRSILTDNGYDPRTDLTRDAAGGWKWNSSKIDMHRRMADYFVGRHEDGRIREIPSLHRNGDMRPGDTAFARRGAGYSRPVEERERTRRPA